MVLALKGLKDSGVYLEPCQTSKWELFTKLVNHFQPLTISTKSFIEDVWQGSECATVDLAYYTENWVSL